MSLVKCPECGHEVSDQAEACPECGCPMAARDGLPRPVSKTPFGGLSPLRAVVIITLVFSALSFCGKNEENKKIQQTNNNAGNMQDVKREPTQQEKKQFFIDRMSIKTDRPFGNPSSILILNVTIKNNTLFIVKDIKISCSVFADSGTELNERVVTLYRNFTPDSETNLKELNMGFVNPQGWRTECKIIDFRF